jgi:steroid delta-isomerase-like uncharacterized protein
MNTTTRRLRTTVIAAMTAAAVVGLTAVTGLLDTDAQAATPSSAQTVAYGRHGARIPRVVAAWADAWNTANPQKMGALFAKDGVYQDNAFQVAMTGPKGAATWITITEQSVKNAHVDVVDAFRSGDKVAVRWNFSGTDTGAFDKDVPATGKSFTVPATTVIDLKGDKIQHLTDYYNLADLLRQAGLTSGPWTPPSTTPPAASPATGTK